MHQATQDGMLGHLTPDQELKLQHAWIHLLRLCGHDLDTLLQKTPEKSSKFLQHLHDKTPDQFRHSLWRFIVNDHPDATVLRFLRARKWDVEAAMEMLVSAINWRGQTELDRTVIRAGEDVALKKSPSTTDKEFIDQYRTGKSYARHTDRQNRPIYIVRVCMHDPSKQGPEAMEKYILHSIESLRLLTRAPNDRACLFFDLTGFGLGNMDYHVVKFLVQVFEARYPETLGAVLVHNAPFVFCSIWSVVKRWLDPNIAAKINFTKQTSDLVKFIHEDKLQRRYGGKDTWEYTYIEPVPGENELLGATEKEAETKAQRDILALQYEKLTADWTAKDPHSTEGKAKDAERTALAEELQTSYWTLDPHIRAKTNYHRAGILEGSTGKVDFEASR